MNSIAEKEYWDSIYKSGGGSGQGSRGQLLEFKANFINNILEKNNLQNVFDLGCGDGYLARLLNCKNYFGIDVSTEAVDRCQKEIKREGFFFEQGPFELYTASIIKSKFNDKFKTQLDAIMCIDALYHVMDDSVVNSILESIFSTDVKLIILYTIPNAEMDGKKLNYINRYNNEKIIEKFSKDWECVMKTLPYLISAAGFFVYQKIERGIKC